MEPIKPIKSNVYVEPKEMLHKKVAALELIKEINKTLYLCGVSVFGLAYAALSRGVFNIVGLMLFLAVCVGFGVRAYNSKRYLVEKYDL